MKNRSITNTETSDLVQLISKEDAETEFGEAVASLITNDSVVSWAKFILTDDKPNGNRQRVPIEEFDNLVKTGAYKPIKMALGQIKNGHDDAEPLGVITNLKVEGNKVIALAALWNHERTDDVNLIKEMIDSNKPVNVSWEILFSKSRVKNGISDLLDVSLKAVTIVGIPAYAGRTQILAVAAKKWSPAYIETLPNTAFLHIEEDGSRYFPYRDDTGKIDVTRLPDILEEIPQAPLSQEVQESIKHQVNKLTTMIDADASLQELLTVEDSTTEEYKLEKDELQTKVSELTAQLALANDKLATKETELATAQELAELANSKVVTLEAELTPLRDFKQEADEAAAKAEKLSAIKAKFESVKLEKSEEYFTENAEKLLSLDDNGLDFMLQEMVAFKEGESGSSEASLKSTSGVPNIPGKSGSLSISDFAAALRERNKK